LIESIFHGDCEVTNIFESDFSKLTIKEVILYIGLLLKFSNNKNTNNICNILLDLFNRAYINKIKQNKQKVVELLLDNYETLLDENIIPYVINYKNNEEICYYDLLTYIELILTMFYTNKTLVLTTNFEPIIKSWFNRTTRYITDMDRISMNIYYKYNTPLNINRDNIGFLYTLIIHFDTLTMDIISFYKLFRYPFLNNDKIVEKYDKPFNTLYIFNGGNYHGNLYQSIIENIYL
jgi:hypothetical protein